VRLTCLVAVAVLAATAACKRGEERAPLPKGAVPVASAAAAPVPIASAPPPPTTATNVAGDLTKATPLSFAPIARAADPGVVTISTLVEPPSGIGRRGLYRQPVRSGLGTGFIIDRDGTILTNNHVIEKADAISVKLADDREVPAKLVGRDPPTDIAVIKIEAQGLHGLPLGDSDSVEVGDWVVAIGNPFGLSHTVSAGIVSAKGRTKDDVPLDPAGYYDFLQTDASINPGNSGGPLINLRGEVVAINSAIRGDAQGIGFAIPINMVKQLLPMLLRDGHVTRSALGIRILEVRELAPESRGQLKLADEKGIVVADVTPGGPAERAGLEPGDVILAFDGNAVERGPHLQWMASTAGVGRTVTLRVSREGKLFDVKIVLDRLNAGPARRRSPLGSP